MANSTANSSPVVIVFGGSRGIGAACADAFASAGWQVCTTYANQPPKASYARSYQVDIRDAPRSRACSSRLKRISAVPRRR